MVKIKDIVPKTVILRCAVLSLLARPAIFAFVRRLILLSSDVSYALEKYFAFFLYFIPVLLFASLIGVTARKNVSDIANFAYGEKFSTAKACFFSYFAGELVYLLLCLLPYDFVRAGEYRSILLHNKFTFGIYTSWPMFFSYLNFYAEPFGRENDIFTLHQYTAEDYLAFIPVCLVYFAMCTALMFAVFAFARKDTERKKENKRISCFDGFEYFSYTFLAKSAVFALSGTLFARVGNAVKYPLCVLLALALPLLYVWFAGKKRKIFEFPEELAELFKSLCALMLPAEGACFAVYILFILLANKNASQAFALLLCGTAYLCAVLALAYAFLCLERKSKKQRFKK